MTGSARAVAVAAVLTLAVSACSAPASGTSTAGLRTATGASVVEQIPPGDRRDPLQLSGTTLDGEPFDLDDHAGQVVVANVWGSWCAPCRAEAPALQAVWEEYRDRGVQFVGVDVKDQPAAARAFERNFGLTYPSIDDSDGRGLLAFSRTLPLTAVPSTVVLDRQSHPAARIIGATSYRELRGLLDDVLAEDP